MTREAYDQVVNAHPSHKAHLTHELLAAAASYEAMKAWNEHQERHGEAVNHAMMKQIMAAAAGAFIDRMIETKGLDAIDRYRVRQQAEGHYGQYGQHGQYEQYGQYGQQGPYGQYGQYAQQEQYGQYGQQGPYGQYGQYAQQEQYGQYGQQGPQYGQYRQYENHEHHGHHEHHLGRHHHHHPF